MEVQIHHEAAVEIRDVPVREWGSLEVVMLQLEAEGQMLGHPHSSSVRGSRGLRELRPKAGRSRWRLLYRRIGERFVILALAPEAEIDRRGFKRAVARAQRRLEEVKR